MRLDKKIFKFLRKRWRDSLVSYDTNFMQDMQMDRRLQLLAAEAADYQRSMNRAENKSCLWQELQDPGNLYKRDPVCLKTCRRIERMALAYCTEGCSRRLSFG